MARKKGPQAKQAYEHIKSKILSFELLPGMVVSDYTLAQELDMSRSPIREAIFMLASDGLIETSDKGTHVASMTMEDIVEICQVRRAVEVAAVDILFDNGGMSPEQGERLTEIYKKLQRTANPTQNYHYDDQFHGEIMSMANNRRLLQVSNQMRLQIYRARWLSFVRPERMEQAGREHEAIYRALMDGDRQGSVRSLILHLDNSEQNFKEVLASPQYSPQFTIAMAHISNYYKQDDRL